MRDAMRYLLVLALGMCVLGWPVGGAVAADSPPELLWQTPDDGLPGGEAGRVDMPRGIAASPTTGRVFVADRLNARISEFTAWGEFVEAWGFGVENGAVELQNCTTATGCQAGQEGGAPGQLGVVRGVAVDSSGAVYVYDDSNKRVTKYSEHGDFLLMFGGEVNKEPGAAEPNVCTASDVADGDDCGPGAPGSAPGFFENETLGNFIAVTADTVYVGDKGRIQAFNLDGTFKGEIPFTGSLAALAGVSPYGLAVDPVSGDIYVSTDGAGDPIYRISPAGALVDEVEDTIQVNSETKTFPVIAASIAVDSQGNLYAVDHRIAIGFHGPFEVLKFDPTGKCVICGAKFAQPDELQVAGRAVLGLATSTACGIPGDDIYVTVFKTVTFSYLQSYGPAPQDVENCPPPKAAPSILEQFAITAGTDDAEVGARINPRFWKDTTYYVQYGPQACLDSGWASGCSTEPPLPGSVLTDKVVNQALATEGVQLEGLEPDTVYHFRFVAESSGGGPVFGVDGTETEEGESSSFRTFPEPLVPPACPNDVFRIGLSAFLPDCRTYEMVSPVDKNGGDILAQKSIQGYPAELNISALDGEAATYSSQTAFADAVSAPYVSQYIAKRDPSAGWQTEAISPPRKDPFSPAGKAELFELDNQYKLFSPDLDAAWLMQEADPPLDECGVAGYINWYRRDNSTGSYEAITTKVPPTKETLTYFSEVQGVGVDGEGRTHTIYRANDKLPVDSGPAAANITGYQLYEHISDPGGGCGETRLVSVLPTNVAWNQESSAGTSRGAAATSVESRENLVHNAVSADGKIIYWTAAGGGPGKIYVRLNETAASATFAVSAGAARFWLASEDGSVAYYTENEDKTLKVFSLSGGTTTVTTQMTGLLGASEDGSRAYFVSKEDLDGSGDAEAEKPNIYLLKEGATTHVATLSSTDAALGVRLRPTSDIPVRRTSSVSEDGKFLAFPSDAGFTGSDNTDILSGLPDTEVYLYEAESDQLRCVSCSLTGVRPSGRVIVGIGAQQGYAAGIPPWKNQFHKPRVISEDGSRVFFESLERLVPRDTNGTQDVYAWMRGADAPACQALGAELFNPVAGGCISLISSAGGGGDASFVDSTPDGSDVLFKTPASLLPQDPGRVDIYDARVGGGFPPPEICTNPNGCPEPPPPPPPPPVTNPGSGTGTPNFDPAKCKALQQKAKKAAAKARALRKKAARAEGAKAKALRRQARKATKQANKKSARAQACFTGARGK